TALLTIVQQSPGLWDMQEVLRRALQVLRISNPETLLLRPEQLAAQAAGAQQAPPPDPAKMAQAQAKTQQIGMQHQPKVQEMQMDAQHRAHEMRTKADAAALESADRGADRQAQLQEAAMKMQVEREKIHADLLKPANQPEDPNVKLQEAEIKAGHDHSAR